MGGKLGRGVIHRDIHRDADDEKRDYKPFLTIAAQNMKHCGPLKPHTCLKCTFSEGAEHLLMP